MTKRVRVLIVDDSALIRSVLERGLAADPQIEVVGTARDPYQARDLLVRTRPDVITLDLEMPRMDGLTFLRRFMAVLPVPTIVLSAVAGQSSALALEALAAGAVEVVAKPSTQLKVGLEEMMSTLIAKVKAASQARVGRRVDAAKPPAYRGNALDRTTDLVIGIGASTGGVAALNRILPVFPASAPGIVIVQHIPAGFSAEFAQHLGTICAMKASEARDGDRVLRGHILVAPGGNRQLEVRRIGGEYRVSLKEGPPVSGHTPSVNVLFNSLAEHVGRNTAGCLLTGMGDDGASGLLSILRAGGHTVAQDRESCAVWGMPAVAHSLGAVERLLPLVDIPAALLEWASAVAA